MKKKIIIRGILGFPIGVTIGYFISIFFSLGLANGYYSPCEPELISVMGSEINAVIMQTFLYGLIGISFAASSVVWEIEHWSVVKQTGIYFIINSLVMMPTAYFLYWMEHSVMGFMGYFGLFVLIFVLIWVMMLIIGKYNVKKMNANLFKAKNEK